MTEIVDVDAIYRVRDFVARVNNRYCGHCAAYKIAQLHVSDAQKLGGGGVVNNTT